MAKTETNAYFEVHEASRYRYGNEILEYHYKKCVILGEVYVEE